MAATRTLLIGAAAFAGGYFANRAFYKTKPNKVVTCFVTEYTASAFDGEIKEDDVLEWVEKAAPGGAKTGFVIHFHGDSPVGAIIYSDDHSTARARVGLRLIQDGDPRRFDYSLGPVEGKDHGDEPTSFFHVGGCFGCPP